MIMFLIKAAVIVTVNFYFINVILNFSLTCLFIFYTQSSSCIIFLFFFLNFKLMTPFKITFSAKLYIRLDESHVSMTEHHLWLPLSLLEQQTDVLHVCHPSVSVTVNCVVCDHCIKFPPALLCVQWHAEIAQIINFFWGSLTSTTNAVDIFS